MQGSKDQQVNIKKKQETFFLISKEKQKGAESVHVTIIIVGDGQTTTISTQMTVVMGA